MSKPYPVSKVGSHLASLVSVSVSCAKEREKSMLLAVERDARRRGRQKRGVKKGTSRRKSEEGERARALAHDLATALRTDYSTTKT